MKLRNFLPKGSNATTYVTNLFAQDRIQRGLPEAQNWAIDMDAANQVVTDLYERITASCEDPDDADALVMQQLPAALLAAHVAVAHCDRELPEQTADDADTDADTDAPTDGSGHAPADDDTDTPTDDTPESEEAEDATASPEASEPAPAEQRTPATPEAARQRVLDRIPQDAPNRDTLVKEANNFRKLFAFDQVHDAERVEWNMPDANHIEMTATEEDGTKWYQKEDIKNGGRQVRVTEPDGTTTNFKSVGALEQWMQKVEEFYEQHPDATDEEYNNWKNAAIKPYTKGQGGSKRGGKGGAQSTPATDGAQSAEQSTEASNGEQTADGNAEQPTASADGEQSGNSSTDTQAPSDAPANGEQSTEPRTEDFGCTYECPAPHVWIHVLPKGKPGQCIALQFRYGSDPAHFLCEMQREIKTLAKKLDELKCKELDQIPVPVLMYLIEHGYVMNPDEQQPSATEQQPSDEQTAEPQAEQTDAEQPQDAAPEQPTTEPEQTPEPTAEDEQTANPTPDPSEEAEDATASPEASEPQPAEPQPAPEQPQPQARRSTAGEYRHPATRTIRAALRAFHTVGKYPYLYGPTGTGKTHVCMQLADDFGVNFTSNGAVYEPTDLIGFTTPNGGHVMTPFLRTYKNGGLHLFDEVDRSNPAALVAVHSAIANGFIDLSDGERIYMHPDFLLVGAGNTIGKGYDSQYTAAQPLDKASRDRMVLIEFTYDEGIERRIAHDDAELLEFVHALRKNIAKAKYDHDLSYREISAIYEYSRDEDLTLNEAVNMACLEGIEIDDLLNLTASLPSGNRYAQAAKAVAREKRNKRDAA